MVLLEEKLGLKRVTLSKEMMQKGSAIERAWISVILLADTSAIRSTIFKVNNLIGSSSSGSIGTLQKLCSTVDKSHDGNLLDLGALLRPMAIRSLLIRGSSISLLLGKLDHANTCTLRVLTVKFRSALAWRKSRTAGIVGPCY